MDEKLLNIRTLGELKSAGYQTLPVRMEMRRNLLASLRSKEQILPGIVGYEETVVPEIENGVLAGHHMIFLGERGQAKSRIIRALTGLLDEYVPAVAGCEINDDPLAPLCRRCVKLIAEQRDATAIAWIGRETRYAEKLATPDVSVADLIGEIDPIKVAEGRYLADEETIHYGLIPRTNRGIFAINELPDLTEKVQVGLFNLMEEKDVQIKGYKIRLAVDVVFVASANPEDYTSRGRIITPLKDRFDVQIRTHYPATVEEGVTITAQEAWTQRDGYKLHVPKYVQEVIERIAFAAREDKKIDKRSGVSQRLPISCTENVISNAERRAIHQDEKVVVPRIADVYAAMPAITGKLELEYEGEMKGADHVSRELIRAAIAKTHDGYFKGTDMQQIVQWFDLGGEIQLSDTASAAEALPALRGIQGLMEKTVKVGVGPKDSPEVQVSAAEFILEGLHAHKRIGRNEERVFTAGEKQPKQADKPFEREEPPFRGRRPYN